MLKLRKIKNVTLSIAKGLRNNSKGMGLIETMIAILLLGMVAVAFLSGISAASRAILISDERSTAQSLALSQMESVKKQDGSAPSGGEVTYNTIDLSEYPDDYSIRGLYKEGYTDTSIDYDHTSDSVIGVLWDPATGTNSTGDSDIQMVTIIIYHPYDPGNPADNVLTLQDYKLDR